MIDLHENFPTDPDLAFVHIERAARSRYQEACREFDEWAPIRAAQFDYMNVAHAAATALDIGPLAAFEIVLSTSNRFEDNFGRFYATAERVVIQIQLARARGRDDFSVELDAGAKALIHDQISKIRQVIEAAGLAEEKKNALFDRLNDLAAEVDRSRTRFDIAMKTIVTLSDTGGEVGKRLVPLRRLVDPILEAMGIAKGLEDRNRLPALEKRAKLEPPKQLEPPTPESEPFKLDDEISF